MFETVRRCLSMLPRRIRMRWVLLIPVAAVTGSLEAGAAAAILGLVEVLRHPAQAATLPVADAVLRLAPYRSPRAIVIAFTGLVVAYFIVKNLAVVAAQYARHLITARTEAELSTTMMRGYLDAPYGWLAERNWVDLRRRTIVLPTTICNVLASAATLLSDVLVAVGLVAVLVKAAPAISLVAVLSIAALLGATLASTRSLAFKVGRLRHTLLIRLDRTVQTAFGSLKELKILAREAYFRDRFAEHQRDSLNVGVLSTTLGVVPPLVVETCFVVGALLMVALSMTSTPATLSLPLLAVFTYAGFRMVPAVNRITGRINMIRNYADGVAELYDDFSAFGAQATPPPADAQSVEREPWREISLEDVSFRFDGSARDVLDGVTLRLRRGESLGIVGRTGAGKTTLVDVLLGVLPPSAGCVLIDGVARRAGEIVGRAAYVPQTVFAADDTLERNVAFGIPQQAIEPGRVLDVLEMVELGALVRSMPDGLGTRLGDRGVRLSGGERQRVGIARALYSDPALLVLDEATAALDSVTEGRILPRIRNAGDRTVVIVAHRLSSIRACDRVAVMADGRIVAVGSFAELMERSPEFRALAMAAEAEVAG